MRSRDRTPNKLVLMQGTLDMLVLRTLTVGRAHGHEIAKHIQRTRAYEWLGHLYVYSGQYQRLISTMEARRSAFPGRRREDQERAKPGYVLIPARQRRHGRHGPVVPFR